MLAVDLWGTLTLEIKLECHELENRKFQICIKQATCYIECYYCEDQIRDLI